MDLAAELAQFNPEPALAAWVGKLLEKTQSDAHTIRQADLKIQALTFEIAYYKRIRFANKSEQFSTEQRDLFEESWNTDTCAQEADQQLPRAGAGQHGREVLGPGEREVPQQEGQDQHHCEEGADRGGHLHAVAPLVSLV